MTRAALIREISILSASLIFSCLLDSSITYTPKADNILTHAQTVLLITLVLYLPIKVLGFMIKGMRKRTK